MARDPLSSIFSALADPARRRILARLKDGAATVTELVADLEAAGLPMSQPAVSRHLKVLAEAGLIDRSQNAQWRSSSLRTEGLREVHAWMQDYRAMWDASFTRLDAHLEQMKKQNPTHEGS